MSNEKYDFSNFAARVAVRSLIEEVELTPKPGLVDRMNPGSHQDLTINLMRKSAKCLKEMFEEMAYASYGRTPSQSLREEIAFIGREGEKGMYKTTSGVNTHKGAIWALGLLVSAAAIGRGTYTIEKIVSMAGETACFPDRYCPVVTTNGEQIKVKYGVKGARGEAQHGFPHIIQVSWPTLKKARAQGMTEETAQLNALLSLIAHLDDTCILHRGGIEALTFAKKQATELLKTGSLECLKKLDEEFMKRNISPGGSADLLAATLFLDKIQVETSAFSLYKKYEFIH